MVLSKKLLFTAVKGLRFNELCHVLMNTSRQLWILQSFASVFENLRSDNTAGLGLHCFDLNVSMTFKIKSKMHYVRSRRHFAIIHAILYTVSVCLGEQIALGL